MLSWSCDCKACHVIIELSLLSSYRLKGLMLFSPIIVPCCPRQPSSLSIRITNTTMAASVACGQLFVTDLTFALPTGLFRFRDTFVTPTVWGQQNACLLRFFTPGANIALDRTHLQESHKTLVDEMIGSGNTQLFQCLCPEIRWKPQNFNDSEVETNKCQNKFSKCPTYVQNSAERKLAQTHSKLTTNARR